MDTDSFIIYIKTEKFFQDIFNDVEKWFGTPYFDKNDKDLFQQEKTKKYLVFLKMNWEKKYNRSYYIKTENIRIFR